MAFKAYDLDGNGVIDKNELFHILKASLKTKGFDQNDEMIQGMVLKCFESAVTNQPTHRYCWAIAPSLTVNHFITTLFVVFARI